MKKAVFVGMLGLFYSISVNAQNHVQSKRTEVKEIEKTTVNTKSLGKVSVNVTISVDGKEVVLPTYYKENVSSLEGIDFGIELSEEIEKNGAKVEKHDVNWISYGEDK